MDNTMEDDDVDMPYAPPLQNANTSRCPNNEASRNGMQPPSTRYPPLMNPWAGYQAGYSMNSTMYGTSSYPSSPYGDGSSNYASPSYAAHWSQNARAQGIPYHNFTDFQHRNSEPPLSRSYPTLPPMSGPPEYNSWAGPWPHNPRAMPMLANENSIADNNNASQRLGNDGVPGASQEQVQQRRRERERELRHRHAPQSTNSEAFGPASPHVPNSTGSSEWNRSSARSGRRLADAQRRAVLGRASRPGRDSDTDEEEWGESDEDDDVMGGLATAQMQLLGNAAFASALRSRGVSLSRALDLGVDGKGTPSKKFLSSLQKMNVDALTQEERSCSICYEEIGVANPEGVIEQPLRMPKCKHIFGDVCLKTWFKENDSCPYCRDKVPTQSTRKVIEQLVRQQMRNRHNITARSAEADLLNSGALDPQEYHTPVWSATDTVESRRRVARGRLAGFGTAPAPPGRRPSLMNSNRLYNPTSQLQNEVNPFQTHSRHNSNSEGVSPGTMGASITNNGHRQPAPLITNSLGHSANSTGYMFPTNLSSGSSAVSNTFMPPPAPSYSQHRPSGFGSMGTPTFDSTESVNPGQHHNYQSPGYQQEDSVAFQSQQLARGFRFQTQLQAQQYQQNHQAEQQLQQHQQTRQREHEQQRQRGSRDAELYPPPSGDMGDF
ncbi:hypothetical protein BHYA_0209g00190 [Botrytis hyacinthi]|uniref:RING-type domain-containing protein n=1 Tax=Botrytis hyacinthi TaxID=278943 RepID=A0A4Z1GI87_9HELO|nr:hypothetical protein BHYA_0209g00190 [Botrytis hyacinthi]